MTVKPTSTTESEPQPDAPPPFEPITITSETELNNFIGGRVDKARANEAKKYPDYENLKAKAAKLDELQAASMTQDEKAAAKIRELETALADSEKHFADQLRAITRKAVAEAKDVPEDTITGDTREEMEASADALLEWRGKGKPKGFAAVPAGGSGASNTVNAGGNAADARRQKMELAAAMVRQLYGPGGAGRK